MEFKEYFAYCGPNRRSDETLVEILIGYTDTDLEILSAGEKEAADAIRSALDEAGAPVPAEGFVAGSASPIEWFANWGALIGLAVQRATGHRVSDHWLIPEPGRAWMRVLFEHEESQVGEQAGRLALHLLGEVFPGLEWNRPSLPAERSFVEHFRSFSDEFAALVQPSDTEAIVRAARKARVPVFKLERDPYEQVKGDFRIRMNSMLMLGHSPYRQVTDGTLALEQVRFDPKLAYMRSPILELLAAEGLPVARHQYYAQPLISPRRARRIRQALGGEVVVKPGRRAGGRGLGMNLQSDHDVSRAADEASRLGGVLFQEFVAGDCYRLLFANNKLLAALDDEGRELEAGIVDPGTLDRLADLVLRLNVGLAMFTLASRDIGAALEESGGKIIDLEVAPELDRVLHGAPQLLESSAEAFISWLFPPRSESRIPIAAVTGTNGKTTTTRMINHVLKHAGRRPGMVCTEGIYIGDEMSEQTDLSNLMGHFRIFESKAVDCAVLEANHKGLAAYGLSFRNCEVAVITNVTEDHLGDWGIETIEDMTAVKRSLAERGRAVVLNADDPNCLSMIPHIEPESLVLSSMTRSAQDLLGNEPRASACMVLGGQEGAEWLELHDKGTVERLLPVAEIPTTFGGAARFNVSNALQCAAACYLLGLAPDVIAQALREFKPSLENTPGRLNLFDDLPFRILVDFAHNPDGFKQLNQFTDTMDAQGRKIIALSASGNRSDGFAERIATACAGHYDAYLCKNYGGLRGRNANELPLLLKRALISHGVDEDQIETLGEEEDPIQAVFSYCRKGDLLVLILGNMEFFSISDEIARFKSGN